MAGPLKWQTRFPAEALTPRSGGPPTRLRATCLVSMSVWTGSSFFISYACQSSTRATRAVAQDNPRLTPRSTFAPGNSGFVLTLACSDKDQEAGIPAWRRRRRSRGLPLRLFAGCISIPFLRCLATPRCISQWMNLKRKREVRPPATSAAKISHIQRIRKGSRQLPRQSVTTSRWRSRRRGLSRL